MDCQLIITQYLDWIRDNTVIKTVEEGKICAISTPFLDRHNDHLDIYLVRENGNFKLTDNGYTLADLRLSGFDVTTPRRESILKTALNGFGVKTGSNDELYVEANARNLGQKKHCLVQAMLAVNDMFNLAPETVYSIFKEDVERFFRSAGIIFSKDIKLSGRSGFYHNIDFLVPAGKTRPERLIRAINNARRDNVLTTLMAFGDISQARETLTKNYVIYNDVENPVSGEVIGALDSYGVRHLAWSKKEQCADEFSIN
jgi:hypothetical protein